MRVCVRVCVRVYVCVCVCCVDIVTLKHTLHYCIPSPLLSPYVAVVLVEASSSLPTKLLTRSHITNSHPLSCLTPPFLSKCPSFLFLPPPLRQVLPVSALQGEGLEGVWSTMMEYKTAMETVGLFDEKRRSQRDVWMWSYVEEELLKR